MTKTGCCLVCHQGRMPRAKGRFARPRGCCSVQFCRSRWLGWAVCAVGRGWSNAPSHSGLQRWRASPWRGWCRRIVGVSFPPVLSLGRCSMLSGMERLLLSPEQPMWLQKWNKFLVFVLLSFWTSSLFLSLNHLC